MIEVLVLRKGSGLIECGVDLSIVALSSHLNLT